MDGGGHGGGDGGHHGGHDGGHDGHSGPDWDHIERVAVDTVDQAMQALSGLLDAVGGADAPESDGPHARDRQIAAVADQVASGLDSVSRVPRSADRVAAAQERALALWRRTGDQDRELDALLWLAERHPSAEGRAQHGEAAEALARTTGDPLRTVRAMLAHGRGLTAAPDTRDDGVALLLATAGSALEALRALEHAPDLAPLRQSILECGTSALDALPTPYAGADTAAVCARFIAEGHGPAGFWIRYERARRQEAAVRELGAERQAAKEAAAGRHAEAAAQWRRAAAVAWQDRGARRTALARLKQAKAQARLAGDTMGAEEAAALTGLAGRIRSVAWSQHAFMTHCDAVDLHKRQGDADAAWQALVRARAVENARAAFSRWVRPRRVRLF